MSVLVQVKGPSRLYIKAYAGSLSNITALTDLAELGWTRNGVDIEEHEFGENVPTDEFGGEQGDGVDKIYYGEIHNVHLDITKFDQTVFESAAKRISSGNWGVMKAPGTLKLQGGYGVYALYIKPKYEATGYLWPTVEFGNPIPYNSSARYTSAILDAIAHAWSDGAGTQQVTTGSVVCKRVLLS